MSDNKSLLTFLGLIRRAGRLETGMDRVIEAIEAGKARLVVVSGDISKNSCKKIAARTDIIALEVSSEQLGAAVGRSGTAIAAICDQGFARAFRDKLK